MIDREVATILRAMAINLCRPQWGELDDSEGDLAMIVRIASRRKLHAESIYPALERGADIANNFYWDDDMCDHFGPDEDDLAYGYAQEAAYIERFGY